MYKYLTEPLNGLTHIIGAGLSLIGLIALIIKAIITNSSLMTIVSVILFGVSMILLYSASATYHSVISTKKVIYILKKIRSLNDFCSYYWILCSILLNST